MSITRISAALRRAVAERAGGRCEYCGVQEDAVLSPHEADHVIAEQHGGTTDLGNLAFSCFRCNRFKGPNIASVDPQDGAIVPLFNPRLDRWAAHFCLEGALIGPLTSIGRATAALLRLNDERRVALRAELIEQGRYVPPQT